MAHRRLHDFMTEAQIEQAEKNLHIADESHTTTSATEDMREAFQRDLVAQTPEQLGAALSEATSAAIATKREGDGGMLSPFYTSNVKRAPRGQA